MDPHQTPEERLREKGAVVHLVKADKAPAKQAGIHVLTPSECAVEPFRDYVIKGIISRGDTGGLIGLPGSAKSTLAPTIGYRTALGLHVFGHRARQVPVLYIAAEDGGGMKKRVKALYERLGDAPQFFLEPAPVDFLTPGSRHIAEIEKLIEELKPGLVIIDTIARAFPGLSENDSDGMGHVVKVTRGFTAICNSAVLSLHHPPKDAMTPRGHGNLNGDFDVTLYLEGQRADTRTVTMGKNRNGPSDLTFSFSVVPHVFPPDEDGDPVTAPVADEVAEEAPTARDAAKEAKLKDSTALLLREIRSLLDGHGEMLSPGFDYPLVRSVSRDLLRSRLIDRSWFPDDLLFKDAESKIKLQRTAYQAEWNALNTLKRKGLCSFNNTLVWAL